MRDPILHTLSMKLYGIPNCNTVKTARQWFSDKGITVVFHDYKKQGVPEEQLDHWINSLGWETVLNRRGTTWRQLDEATRQQVSDAASARALMLQYPSLIKRPIVEAAERVIAGFDESVYESLIK